MAAVAKGHKGIGMNGLIAAWYARITAKDIEFYKKDARRVAGWVPEGSAVLEVAPGPGYLVIELAKLGHYQIAGLDISASFVNMARANAQEAGVDIDFRQGDAAHNPFGDETFDFVICRAAFKNFSQPVEALNEMVRVLKPGGRALIIDLRGDVSRQAINEHVDSMGLGRINTFMTRGAFRFMLIKRAYTVEGFKTLLAKSKVKQYDIQTDPIGLEVWLEK